ncbi:MAG: glycosyltransferase family 4 protein [Chloroflexi bacterium]|nr:glycosyltransferase family 4 protein [Chloroflexota bacterium]
MRIAMVARLLPRADYAGGVSGQVHLQAIALADRGHDVTVFALNAPPSDAPYRYRRIRVAERAARHPLAQVLAFAWAIRRGRFDDYDILHTHGDDHLLETRRPVVRTFYGSAWAEARAGAGIRQRLYHGILGAFERISERRATAIAMISASTQRYLRRQGEVIPCGFDPRMYRPSSDKSEVPSILFVGDMGTRKRGDLLLDVFARTVHPQLPEAELWMVTSDPAFAAGVRWLGRLSDPELVRRYQRAWVLCLPSRYEGFGVPYIEAMACGTPVIATPNGGAEEILGDGHWGRLVSVDALGTALVTLLTSHNERAELRRRGLERAHEYEISRVAARYERLYRSVVEAPGMPVAGKRLNTEC